MSERIWSSIWWTTALALCVLMRFFNSWQAVVALGILAILSGARALVLLSKN